MEKLTKEQAIVVTGYTGFMCTANFSDFHADVEKRLGRPVFTHEFADKEFKNRIEDLYRQDFISMVPA